MTSAGSWPQVADALLRIEAALTPRTFLPGWAWSNAAVGAADAEQPRRDRAPGIQLPPSRLGSDLQGANESLSPTMTTVKRRGRPPKHAATLDPLTMRTDLVGVRGAVDLAEDAGSAPLSDPYDLARTSPARAGWGLGKRSASDIASGIGRLPRAVLRKAARQAGRRVLPCVHYGVGGWRVSRRTAWIGRMEAASTTPQLAVALRQLDSFVQVRKHHYCCRELICAALLLSHVVLHVSPLLSFDILTVCAVGGRQAAHHRDRRVCQGGAGGQAACGERRRV